MQEMDEIHSRSMSRQDVIDSIQRVKPRPTDIVISPAGKCGTTLLQQTFHTLRTGGDMDFDDISRVVPWIETSIALGLDINAEQVAEPRGFKSHLSWHHMPKGAKYIVSLRDPIDAFVSGYHFMEGWYFEPGSISLEDFFEPRRAARGKGLDHWAHLVSWWEQRDNPNVLLLAYEHLINDRQQAIQRIADFCQIELTDELLTTTLEHTSRPFMLQHKDRFDDAMMREMSERKGGLPPNSDSAKVRAKGAGKARDELSPEMLDTFDEIWRSDVQAKTDHASYADLAEELRRAST